MQDLGPLRDMRQLANLNLRSCSMLQDLTPLQGLALTELDLVQCTLVEDLTPIKRLPLTKLLLSYTRVVDLTPVEGMKLKFISFAPRTITRGINVLRAMKSLKFVDVTAVRTFAAEDFWPRYEAGEFR